MADPTSFRQERVEKLLHELEYEVKRGMLEGEVDETMGFDFYVPLSRSIPDGVVRCSFRTRPIHRVEMSYEAAVQPRLRLVKT